MLTYPPSLLNLCGSDAEVAWRLCHGLDLRIEASQRLDGSIQGTLDRVSPWILNEIGAGGLGLLIHDQSDPWTDDITPDLSTAATFFVGHDRNLLQKYLQEFQSQSSQTTQAREAEHSSQETEEDSSFKKPCIIGIPLRVDHEIIGILAASFHELPQSPGADILLEVVGQELNNLFYEFRRARLRHAQVLELGRLLQNPVLEVALNEAIAYMFQHTQFSNILLVYGEDTQPQTPLCIRLYRNQPEHTPPFTCQVHRQGDPSPLGQLFTQTPTPNLGYILHKAGMEGEGVGSATIDVGLRGSTQPGLVCAVSPLATEMIANQELLEQLANALAQRLVDHHKDRRYLQSFFSLDHVSRLLSVGNYRDMYLTPRLQEVAMLYTDINSFTKISEQILDSPQEVGELVDYWANGVVNILYEHQGVFDKMVGDCVIGLFGPPFDERTPGEKVAAAVHAALQINAYTRDLMGTVVVEKVRRSALIPGLGVATGVSYGSAMVGIFGPNNDFTAFGREMNSTARLQGLAGFREILVMEAAYGVLCRSPHPVARELLDLQTWSDRREAKVKNVQEPLYFRSVTS
jgi:adenylate cyclase